MQQQIRTGEISFELAAPSAAVLAPQPRSERGFWLAFALAVLLHMSLFVGLWKAPVRHIGDPAGSVEGIDVDFVDASELASRMQGAAAAAPPPSPPVPQVEPSQAAEPATAAPPPPPAETAALQQPAPPVERPPPPAPAEPVRLAEPPTAEKAPEKAEAAEPAQQPQPKAEARKDAQPDKPPPPAEEINLADLLKPQISNLPPAPKTKESTEKERSKERERQKEKQKEARAEPAPARPKVDFSPPSSSSYSMPGGGGAGVSRPPGITRSGENDDFARGVVAALRRTMPDPRNRLGRVTIRLVLNEIGNVKSVELLAGSGNGSLDQDVQFAARQSNFPLPPRNATLVDRTFQITYIYR